MSKVIGYSIKDFEGIKKEFDDISKPDDIGQIVKPKWKRKKYKNKNLKVNKNNKETNNKNKEKFNNLFKSEEIQNENK